jgi:hypothetical protein
MSEERLARLIRTQHSVATRVPKIVLRRAEDIFPSLKTSMVSVLWSCFGEVQVAFCITSLITVAAMEALLHTKPATTANSIRFCPCSSLGLVHVMV